MKELQQAIDGTEGYARMFYRRHDEITDVIRHHWNERAVTFDRGHGLRSDEQREAWLDLLSRLSESAPQRVLDVGCGTGFLALMFAQLGHAVTGIDLAPQMLQIARNKAQEAHLKIEFHLENAASLSDPDDTYDLVVARHVIWALPDPAKGVAEWLRVLRPGGRLALIEGKWAYNNDAAQSPSIKTAFGAVVETALKTASYCVGRKHWKLYSKQYKRIQAQLPFSGGPPAERLVEFLQDRGLHDVTAQPLMDPVLWGETPPFPRYLVTGRR